MGPGRMKTNKDKVRQLRPNAQWVAKCPKCNGQEWRICLDGPALRFEGITAFECVECENKTWIMVGEKEDE